MSVVVEHPDEKNKAICCVKGADTNILPLIKVGSKEDIKCKEQVEVNVEQFACKGLRTLCFAMKVIDWQ
jgi:magnesium-transporting ATPase (P-type)